MSRLTRFAVLVVLAGCAQPYALPPLAPEHPASASSPEAPAPPASVAFGDESDVPTTKQEPSAQGGHAHHGMHGGH